VIPELRELRPADREPIRELLGATEVFREEELSVALELVDLALQNPAQTDYLFRVAECGGEVAGYACWGPTPCTRGTFDLYWIAVHPRFQGLGVAHALMKAAESDMQSRGGRLCVVQTSALPSYDRTRGFYEKIGYTCATVLPDYYAPGDALCIYTRFL
jgi:ribosomal protein S18 acetylase RimI-like enzyme